jgi:hypothetical protein
MRYWIVRDQKSMKYVATKIRSLDEAVRIMDRENASGGSCIVLVKGGGRSRQVGGVSREEIQAARERVA